MERLCFGTFIDVLTTGRLKSCNKTSFVTAIIQTIDSKTLYANIDSKDTDKETKDAEYRSLNHLYKCTNDFSPQYTNLLQTAPKADTKAVCQNFEQNIVPYIDIDKYELIILALCDIVRKDPTLDYEKGGENTKKFAKYVGKNVQSLLNSTEYILSEFLSGIFLYTVNGVQNIVGKEWLKSISSEYKKYDDYFENYTNSFISQKKTIKVFSTHVQKEQFIINNNISDSEIAIPNQCKVCFYCENWNSNVKTAYKYTNNIYGICKLHNKNTLSSESCSVFSPKYGRITLFSSTKNLYGK